MYTTEW